MKLYDVAVIGLSSVVCSPSRGDISKTNQDRQDKINDDDIVCRELYSLHTALLTHPIFFLNFVLFADDNSYCFSHRNLLDLITVVIN